MKVKIPIINVLINKRYKARLRVINKGYQQLKNENKLELPMQLRDAVSRTQLNNKGLPKGLLCQSNCNVELSIRQYLFERLLRLSFNRSILYSIGSNKALCHPLPKEWRDVLVGQGIRVNNFISSLLWYAYSFLFWGRGVFYGLESIYYLLVTSLSNPGKYIYFDELSKDCLSKEADRYNVVNWYLQWKNKAVEIDSICHSVNNTTSFKLGDIDVVQTDGLPRLKGLKLFQYVLFVVYASSYSFLCLFFKPVYGIVIYEVLKLKRIDLAYDHDLAKDYLFNNSVPFYRPLWTYLAEEKGARILFYFYSTNNEAFKTENGPVADYPWYLISWSYYLVWDKYQAEFIKKFDQYSSVVEEVGQIWFLSSGEKIEVPSGSIAVFDVTPYKYDIYILLGLSPEYYVYRTSSKFLSDIYHVLNDYKFTMLHKMKRESEFSDTMYLRKINQLSKKVNYTSIDPGVDAMYVIQQTKACVSMPFTSTAIIAKKQGKPSVYYDPTGNIQKDDNAAHGIQVINNLNELEEWVKTSIAESNNLKSNMKFI